MKDVPQVHAAGSRSTREGAALSPIGAGRSKTPPFRPPGRPGPSRPPSRPAPSRPSRPRPAIGAGRDKPVALY
ncbi:hypothetical protein GLA29479_2002 [Lysobacter antibioticus]|nr:hypothetical protein GLA29479_2002 [Lysobacter antibioticus]